VGYTPYQVALLRGMPEIAALIKAKGGRSDPLQKAEQFQAACMAELRCAEGENGPLLPRQARDKHANLPRQARDKQNNWSQ
jgi:hypothetical protein